MKRKLRQTESEYWISGVCGGIAYWLGIPVWVVRMIWFGAIFIYGIGLGLYIILAIFLPEWEQDPKDFYKVTGD
jgi:phage shock protein C